MIVEFSYSSDDAHAALAELLDDLVAQYGPTDHGGAIVAPWDPRKSLQSLLRVTSYIGGGLKRSTQHPARRENVKRKPKKPKEKR